MPPKFTIRVFQPADDLLALTELLHAAYRPLAESGLYFLATHQTPDVTTRRIARGTCLIAEGEGRLMGTITSIPSSPDHPLPLYREQGLFHFGQFGVHPDFKGRGLGRRLHQAILELARNEGGKIMALDTAASAVLLALRNPESVLILETICVLRFSSCCMVSV